MQDSSPGGSPGKSARTPRKPHPNFPLFIHERGEWCKKVRGRRVYFGKVTDDPKV